MSNPTLEEVSKLSSLQSLKLLATTTLYGAEIVEPQWIEEPKVGIPIISNDSKFVIVS